MTDIFKFHEGLVEEYKRFSTSFTSIGAADIRLVVEVARDRGDRWPEPLILLAHFRLRSRELQCRRGKACRGLARCCSAPSHL